MRRLSLPERIANVRSGVKLEPAELRQLAGDLLGALEVQMTNATAAPIGQPVSGGVPGSVIPTAVPGDCRCGCTSEYEHQHRELIYSMGRSVDHVRAWIVGAGSMVFPEGKAGRALDPSGIEAQRDILIGCRGLRPVDAAIKVKVLYPGNTLDELVKHVTWLRKDKQRHRETGEMVPTDDEKPAQALVLRDQQMTLEQIAAVLDCHANSVRKWLAKGRA
jgi:hypothetical protein